MATYNLALGERGAYSKTLVAATVDTVTFNGDYSTVEVHNAGAGSLTFTLGSVATPPADPTVGSGANGGYEVPAGSVRDVKAPGASPPVVKLRSAATPTYSVTGE